MNNFIFENKTKVYFGRGCAKEYLTCLLKQYGNNVMLAYGGGSIKKNGVYTELMEYLKAAGKTVTEFSGIMSNPTYAKVQEGAKIVRENGVDLILAVGGGSVIDCCKIISAQAKTDEDNWKMDSWPVVSWSAIAYPSSFVPMIVIVTASGTGAEMNNGAVITNEEKKTKAGLLGAQADIAMLDPDYTMSLPMTQVISGAFDTLSHCMETYFGKPEKNNLSDDMNEAIKVADLICIMRGGNVLQYDTPENILKNPADDYVANFVGKNRIWSSPEYIKVEDIMIERPVTATKEMSILKCMDKMRQYKVDSLLIIEPGSRHLLGIVKANQLRSIEDKTQPIRSFISADFAALNPEQTILDAIKLVTKENHSTIPVVDSNFCLVGLITKSSLVTTLSQQYFDYTEEEQE